MISLLGHQQTSLFPQISVVIFWTTPLPPPIFVIRTPNPSCIHSSIRFLHTPLVVAWVNKWTFSSPPPLPPSPSHLQLCVSLRYRKYHGGWRVGPSLSMHPCFLPMPLAVAWVFRLTFSPPSSPSSSHLQLLVYLRYRKHCGRRGSLAVYAILFKYWEQND